MSYMSYILIESNTWIVPEYPMLLSALAVFTVITVLLSLCRRRRDRRVEVPRKKCDVKWKGFFADDNVMFFRKRK